MNGPERHLGEEAELYALGLLEPDERDAVDGHAAACAACAARVGEAERTVAALLDATVLASADAPAAQPQRARPRWPYAAAACALFAAGLAAGDLRGRSGQDVEARVLQAMTASHFAHVPFTAVRPGPVTAKLVYEPHGAWYAVIEAGVQAPLRLTQRTLDGRTAAVATRVERRGDVQTAYFETAAPLAAVDIVDSAGRIVAEARPGAER